MSVFTLEVAGRPVACIRAANQAQAQRTIDDPWFRDGLLGLDSDGQAAWDGRGELRLREASVEEQSLVEQRPSDLERSEAAIVYLSPPRDPTPADHRLLLASRVEHAPVFDQSGKAIGHIQDLSIDRQDGRVAYAIMSFGGFLGIGRKFHPLPWAMLRYDAQQGGYVVNLDREALANAPHYEPGELREFGGPSRDADRAFVLEYYGRYGPPLL